jgi:hypothetical protein
MVIDWPSDSQKHRKRLICFQCSRKILGTGVADLGIHEAGFKHRPFKQNEHGQI